MTKKKEEQKNKYQYQKAYADRSQKIITFKFHKENDKDILEYFENQGGSKLNIIREAMRQYIKSNN